MLVKDWRPYFVAFAAPPVDPHDAAAAHHASRRSSSSATPYKSSASPQTPQRQQQGAEKTRLLVFRNRQYYERYLDLGSSPYRNAERAALVKKSVDVCYFHKCTPIKVKRYEAFGSMSRRASLTSARSPAGANKSATPSPTPGLQQTPPNASGGFGHQTLSLTGDLPHFSLEELSDYGAVTTLKFACTGVEESSPERTLLTALRQYLNDIIRNGRYERRAARPAVPSPFE